ncbi:MAG: glycoside hydrolase family 3 N-terminal domain-containing protein [Bifidobacterium sp.]
MNRRRSPQTRPGPSRHRAATLVLVLCLLSAATAGAWWWHRSRNVTPHAGGTTPTPTRSALSPRTDRPARRDRANLGEHRASAVPRPAERSDSDRARDAVRSMSLDEQIGQLVMIPFQAGEDISQVRDTIVGRQAGSVLLLGNWNGGVDQVRSAADSLQRLAPGNRGLIIATDQEGGMVQHLQGPGFSPIPPAVEQGRMQADQLEESAREWGSQLLSAGVNVDLAPVVDTVEVSRALNAPIGALDRDFGLDATGNAAHAQAFIDGMRSSGVSSVIKHYPGLGGVTGNTDFTDQGVLDTSTTPGGPEIEAFDRALSARPAMVMMSLATYRNIDGGSPAAFSPTILDGQLRTHDGYQGVVISDSLSAAAVSGISADELGTRLIEAGGDVACIGDPSMVAPILEGLSAKAHADPVFAQKVTRSAIRVMTLKYQMKLAR